MVEFGGARDACAPVQQDAVASRFKVGDRVRVVSDGVTDLEGATGTVSEIIGELEGDRKYECEVEIDGGGCYLFAFDEIEAFDPVNHPAHYTQYPVEVIEIAEHLNFCRGNAVKYICRAGYKGDELEDLRKAAWYIKREIERLEKSNE